MPWNKPKKIAVLTLAYNAADTLPSVLQNWGGIVGKHLILVSRNPWHGARSPDDGTYEIAKHFTCGVTKYEAVLGDWRSETEQRNWGLGNLYDYDWVIIADADELYTRDAQHAMFKIMEEGVQKAPDIEEMIQASCYRAEKVITYFKATNLVLDPPDSHLPAIMVNPKEILFHEHRIPNTDYQPIIPVEMHHLTYLRPDEKIRDKMYQFEHHDQVNSKWFSEVWKQFKPRKPMAPGTNLRAYGLEVSSAVSFTMPEDIKKLLTN